MSVTKREEVFGENLISFLNKIENHIKTEDA
jgi:hypothetical protein